MNDVLMNTINLFQNKEKNLEGKVKKAIRDSTKKNKYRNISSNRTK